MKKIKVFIIVLLVVVTFSFLPAIHAEEIAPTIDEQLEIAKSWIIGVAMTFISGGGLATISYFVLNKLRNNAMDKLAEAVDSNLISQDTANKTVALIDEGIGKVQLKFDNFEKLTSDQLQHLDDDIVALMEKLDAKFLTLFNQAIMEYIEADNVIPEE